MGGGVRNPLSATLMPRGPGHTGTMTCGFLIPVGAVASAVRPSADQWTSQRRACGTTVRAGDEARPEQPPSSWPATGGGAAAVERILIRHIRGMRSGCKSARCQVSDRLPATVGVRSVPLLTVRCGTRVARPANDVGSAWQRWARPGQATPASLSKYIASAYERPVRPDRSDESGPGTWI